MPKTEEELAAEAEAAKKADDQRIADLVNKAAADHAKRAMAKYEKGLEERDVRIAQLEAQLKKPEAEKQAAGAAEGDPSDKRIKELEARMVERDRKLDEERKARESEKQARLRDEEKNVTIQALAAAEIIGDLQEGALLVLQSQGRVGRDEAGKVCWLEQKEGYVDKVPVAEGVKRWATEGSGKAYLPARGVGGSGTKPPAAGARPAANKNERVSNAKKELVSAFFGNGGQS